MTDSINTRYQELVTQYAAEQAALRRRDIMFSTARLLVFLVLLLLILLAFLHATPWWMIALPITVFIALAVFHEQTIDRLEQASILQRIHEQQLARRARHWSEVPVPETAAPAEKQVVARDLDVFGSRSVFQWLSVAYTPMGKSTLRDWLMTPASGTIVEARQRVVQALAREFEWREQLQLHGAQLGPLAIDTKHFVDWANGKEWLAQRPWLKWVARALPFVLMVLAIASWLQVLPTGIVVPILVIILLLNIALSVMYTGEIHNIFDTVAGHSDQVWHYRQMLLVATQLPEDVGHIEIANSELREIARHGVHRLSSLHQIVRLLNARRDMLTGILYLAGQIVLLMHIHLLSWLEVWQRRWGHESAAWFAALGQLEALASLATAAYDHPEWSFAKIDASAKTLRAEAIGHPLLPNEQRVTNDVKIGPPGTLLLVTGSNMSGKSTLLRSIGVNTLLAQAGGPVCARELVLPPLQLETSMRISDSLADGVSFFLAELKRLKEIVEHARSARASERQLMFLLDEILQGTNSRERQVAVIRVIGHLLEQGAIGAVTTHDLELATTEALRDACQVVHFRESFHTIDGQQSMTFDYKLRPGVAPTTNALVLLEMVGLK